MAQQNCSDNLFSFPCLYNPRDYYIHLTHSLLDEDFTRLDLSSAHYPYVIGLKRSTSQSFNKMIDIQKKTLLRDPNEMIIKAKQRYL